MITLEQVERLREKTGVSFADAKNALEMCNGDMLDAIIWLERQGLLDAPEGGGQYSTIGTDLASVHASGHKHKTKHGESFGDNCRRFFRWCGVWIKKGNTNYLDVSKNDEMVIAIPVTLLVLLFLLAFWAVLILLVVGLFCGFHYKLRGAELGRDAVNHAMDQAARTAEDIKRDVKSGLAKNRESGSEDEGTASGEQE